MRLKKFKTEVFAGISDQNISFNDGLNVILGPNEAGKSTIIHAIFSTLFKDPKIRLNRKEDINFHERFMPYPEGDYVHGCLQMEIADNEYKIEKRWSRENPRAYLELPDGQRIENINKINAYQKEILLYGKSTYNNIVFTKQNEIKNTIKRIAGSKEVTSTVFNFLRRAVMELDGVSLEKLNSKIDEELNNLLKKWDFAENRPVNPDRDVNYPYQQGYGSIYEAYINKEKARIKMEKTKEIEKKFEQVSSEVKDLQDKKQKLDQEIEELAELEDDIFQRGQLQPEISSIKDKIENLKEVNKKWPVLENNFNQDKKELNKYREKLQNLKQEKSKARKLKKRNVIKNKIKKVEEIKVSMEKLNQEKTKLGEVSRKDVKELTELKSKISSTEASLKAARLSGKINFSSSDEITITRGINKKEIINTDQRFKAEGYIRIESENIDIEITSEEIDFEKLKTEFNQAHQKFESLLEKLDVKNVEQARMRLNKINEINNEIRNKKKRIEEVLEGKPYNQIKDELNNYNIDQEKVREVEEIEREMEKLKEEKIDELKVNIKTASEKLKNWKNKFENHDKLFDKLIELRSDLKEKSEILNELAEVPDDFNSPSEFKTHLSQLRKKKQKLDNMLSNRKTEMWEIKNKLPDNSYEELRTIYQEEKNKFKKLISKAEKILKIKQIFQNKLDEIDQNSFKPLVDSFNKYLSILTGEKYQVGEFDENFAIKVEDQSHKKIPADINLLSYGTYDGVALALRFALLDNLFDNRPGFIILDDCLVNLDPDRTKKAIELINKFREKYQIIFTTCNPVTAEKLGGNIISL
ncbi:MAG: ATP-binding protein [Halanaerobiaceae bacterium]